MGWQKWSIQHKGKKKFFVRCECGAAVLEKNLKEHLENRCSKK